MRIGTISVLVGRGIFSWEQSVSFNNGQRTYQMLIEKDKIRPEGTILVKVLEEIADKVVIELPAETVNSGRRVHMPRDKVRYLKVVK